MLAFHPKSCGETRVLSRGRLDEFVFVEDSGSNEPAALIQTNKIKPAAALPPASQSRVGSVAPVSEQRLALRRDETSGSQSSHHPEGRACWSLAGGDHGGWRAHSVVRTAALTEQSGRPGSWAPLPRPSLGGLPLRLRFCVFSAQVWVPLLMSTFVKTVFGPWSEC